MVANNNTKALSIIEDVKADPAVIAMQNNLNEVKAIQQAVFQRGVHYGAPYKGSKNDTLLKPGATFLQQKYGLREQHERIETTIHVDPTDLSKSYIIIQNRCRLFNSDGVEVAQASAACTTFEDKYVYRGGGDKTCPDCGGVVLKSKFADRQTGDIGWYCKDCKHNFISTDEKITGQDTTKKLNPNPLNMLDTIIAMAEKRSSVRATIKATGVDALFSPGDGVVVDYYDDVVDGLEKSSEELITVVAKNATQTHQEGRTEALGEESTHTSQPPANDAATAKSRFAGNGAPTNGEKKRIGNDPAPSWKTNVGAVKTAVRPLYDNGKHMDNSIALLEKNGKLTDDMSVDLAIRVITNHKDEMEAPF